MIVLSDTSPLNYLVLIGHVDVLPDLFGKVIIPQAVALELGHVRAPDAVQQWVFALPQWCEVRAVSNMDPTIVLGRGESEAICLAEELHADLLLMDDRLARQVAEGHGLRVVGTVNVLEAAAERNLLELPDAISKLRKTNFHIADEILQQALAADAARKRRHSAES